MSDNGGQLKAIAWRDLCPWLIIFRSFGLSISLPILFLAVVGAVLTPAGWWLSAKAFVPRRSADEAFQRIVESNWRCPCEPIRWPGRDWLAASRTAGEGRSIPVASLPTFWYQQFILPFQKLFDTELSLSRFAYFLFGGLWTLLVWAFFGGAITRMAAMQLGREERISLKDALTLACRKYGSYVAAPLLPLLGVVLVGLPVAVLGLFMMADWGVVLGGVFWVLVLVCGFIMAVLLLGLLFGWPLMWTTVSAEGSDAFDGLSRSYAYTFQRPLHYLFYAAIASLFGLVCFSLVYFFSEAIIQLCYWAASWGTNLSNLVRGQPGGEMRIGIIQAAVRGMNVSGTPAPSAPALTAGGALWVGAFLIYAFNGLVHIIVRAFVYSFFWCAVTAVYLLLRRDVDQTEFDEIWVEEDEQAYGLPPVKPEEEAAAPEPAEPKAEEAEAAKAEAAEGEAAKGEAAEGEAGAEPTTPSEPPAPGPEGEPGERPSEEPPSGEGSG